MKNEVIDVEVKDVKIEQFLSKKKELVLNATQRTVEAYLEIGKHLKEVNEKLATYGVKSRWKAWLEEVGFEKQNAINAILVYEKYGERKNIFPDSISILQQLSKPSNDPEKVALVEQKLANGEKMTVAQVKKALKKLPEAQQQTVAKASYELAEEKRTGMTSEELDTFYAKQEVEYQNDVVEIKQLEPIVKKQYADMVVEATIEEFEDMLQLCEAFLEIREFAESKGFIATKPLSRDANKMYGSIDLLKESIEHAKKQLKLLTK